MMTVVTEFTPFASTLGGVLIGLSAVILMLFHGRIAGIALARFMRMSHAASARDALR